VSKSFMAKGKQRSNHDAAKVQRGNVQNPKPTALTTNATWHLDLREKPDDAGVVRPVLSIVDRGSGATLMRSEMKNTNFFTVAGHMLLAFGRFGKPDAIHTDPEMSSTIDKTNGSEGRGSQHAKS
jgi:putative transposase